jgi:hypothetical protein
MTEVAIPRRLGRSDVVRPFESGAFGRTGLPLQITASLFCCSSPPETNKQAQILQGGDQGAISLT